MTMELLLLLVIVVFAFIWANASKTTNLWAAWLYDGFKALFQFVPNPPKPKEPLVRGSSDLPLPQHSGSIVATIVLILSLAFKRYGIEVVPDELTDIVNTGVNVVIGLTAIISYLGNLRKGNSTPLGRRIQ